MAAQTHTTSTWGFQVATAFLTRFKAEAGPTTPRTSRGAEQSGVRGMPHISALDGVRAIAVIGVLLYHADVPWMPAGFLGVDVFFVLSGFLITSIVMTELGRTSRLDFKYFYLRRARRLLPAVFLVLGFSAILGALIATDAAAALRRDIPGALLYVTNWVYVFTDQSYFEISGRPPMLQHLWSLAVEEQFYLIWPAVVFFAYRRGGRGMVRRWALRGALISTALMVLLSLFGGYPQPNDASRVYFGTDAHAMALLIGAALACAWIPQRLRTTLPAGAKATINAIGAASIGLIVLVMMTSHSNSAWLYRGGFGIFAVLVAVMIAAVTHPVSVVGRLLGRQPMKYIGERSYGLYLWHWPIFLVLRPGLDVPLEGAANFLLRMGLTFGAAELSYRYVEMPVRNGALRDAWPRARARLKDFRDPSTRRILAGLAAGLVFASIVGVRLWTIPDETPDYLSGQQDISAIDMGSESGAVDRSRGSQSDGANSQVGDAEPPLSDSIKTGGQGTFKPGIVAVGDSVMLGAQGGLRTSFGKISIDASVARQAGDMLGRLRALRDAGALRETVILHTGTNGYIEKDQLSQMLKILAPAKRIVVVNVHVSRVWNDPNNELLAEIVKTTPNAVLADWDARASSDRELTVTDGAHPTQSGVKAYADTIQRALSTLKSAQSSVAAGTASIAASPDDQ